MDVDLQPVHFRECVAVHQQQVFPAVVVEVEKTAAPAYIARVVRHAGGGRDVVELGRAAIAVEGLALIGKVGAKDVGLPIAAKIGGGGAHVGHGFAVFNER